MNCLNFANAENPVWGSLGHKWLTAVLRCLATTTGLICTTGSRATGGEAFNFYTMFGLQMLFLYYFLSIFIKFLPGHLFLSLPALYYSNYRSFLYHWSDAPLNWSVRTRRPSAWRRTQGAGPLLVINVTSSQNSDEIIRFPLWCYSDTTTNECTFHGARGLNDGFARRSLRKLNSLEIKFCKRCSSANMIKVE